MPIYRFEGPDGKVHRVEADSPEAAQAGLEQTLATETPHETSQGLGFAQGVDTVVKNAAETLQGPQGLSAPARALNTAVSVPLKMATAPLRKEIAEQVGAGVHPGGAGHLAGTLAATAPLGVGLGPVIMGASQGYLSSDAKSPLRKGVDALAGGAAGKAGEGLMRAGAAALRGVGEPAARFLSEHGVRLPPSAVIPQLKHAEEALSSVPIVGGAVRKARAAFKTDVQRAAIDKGLAEVGDALPKGLTGHEAVAYAQDAISDYYNTLLPKLSAKLDPEFGEAVSHIDEAVSTLPSAYRKQFRATIQAGLSGNEEGALTGRQLKDMESSLGQEIADYSASSRPEDLKMRRALTAARDELRAMIARQNPDHAADLQSANRAFRIQAIVDNAASKADDGEFSALQLKTASRQADRSVRKRATARGEGSPLQELATAARTVEKAVIGNSGTADRLNLANPLMLAAGVPLLAGYKAVQAGTKALSGPRPAFAAPLAEKLERLARPFGFATGAAVANRPR